MSDFRSSYTGRFTGIGRLLRKPGVQLACRAAALELKGIAEARSPVGDPASDPHPGQYRSSFAVVPIEREISFRGRPAIRAGARLLNIAPHALHVEYGNGGTPRYAVLSKSVDDLKAAHRAL